MHKMILVRGTPGSGKSTLLHLIAKHLETTYPYLEVIKIPFWNYSPSVNTSEQLMQKFTNYSYWDLLNLPNTIILIDEGQETYNDSTLWNQFKNSSAMFILFSSYGSAGGLPERFRGTPAPLKPAQRISFEWEPKGGDSGEVDLADRPVGLNLQPEEAADLIQRFARVSSRPIAFDDNASKYLTQLSGGHAGALAGILEHIAINTVSILFCCFQT